jgi:hypothetical protein
MLGEPLGWSEKEYRNNFEKQDDFFEELNIPTYNNFESVLFYDVIQALVKVFLVNNIAKAKAEEEAELIDSVFNTDSSMEDE